MVIGATAALTLAALAVLTAGAGAAPSLGAALAETILSPTAGATVARGVVWTVQVSGGAAARVDFAIDGKARSSLRIDNGVTGLRTYRFGGSAGSLDTTRLANGVHRLRATTFGRGTTRATAEVTVTVANEPPPASGAPTLVSLPLVRGDALVGRTLSSTEGQWSGLTPMTFAWIWLRCHEEACSEIPGASSPSYVLTGDDAGYRVKSRVTATNERGSGSESSAPTDLVTAPV